MGITVVFDFGNVLGLFSHRLTTERLAPHADLPADQLHRVLFGSQLEEDYECGRFNTDEYLTRIRRAVKLTCSDDFVREAVADIFTRNDALCSYIPELAAQYPLYLLSNTCDLHAGRFLADYDATLKHFRAVFLSHHLNARKPNAAIYQTVQEKIGRPASELLFIDDRTDNVETARACGWRGVVFTGVDELRRLFAVLNGTPTSPL